MASLNTLRTKFGVVLSIVIGIALLAFILSLKTEMGFSGNDPKVGVINGENITYTEYLDAYEATKSLLGGEASTSEEMDRLAAATWQKLFSDIVLLPGFEQMGLVVTPAERKAVINGTIATQALYNLFMDPQTGTYNVEAVANFLAQAEVNPQVSAMWLQLVEQACSERLSVKYGGILKNGVNVNSAEVAIGVDAANKVFAGKFVQKPYTSVPDSIINVTSSEIKSYYNANKKRFKQVPSRTISYVVFNVDATDDDMLAIENEVRAAEAEFAVAEDLKAYSRENRRASLSNSYLSLSQFDSEEAEQLAAGKMYGPVLKNNVWTMSRVYDAKMAPDSIGVRHLAVPYNQEEVADSLANELKAGADFAQLAAGIGEERVYPFAAFTEEFVPSMLSAKVGDVVKVVAGNAIHVMQVIRVDKPSKHIRSVSVNYPVVASSATERDLHGKAGILAVDGAGSYDKFVAAASAAAVTPRTAVIRQGERQVRGLEESHDIVRWASAAKKGAISEIFKVGGDYVVAMLTAIDNNEYTPVEVAKEQIANIIRRDKKYDYIVSNFKGTTLEEYAQSYGVDVKEFSDLSYSSFFVQNLGFEPRVIGAISVAEQGAISAPVKGNAGVVVFLVEDIATEETQTAESEQVRAQATAEDAALQLSFRAVQQMAEMEDLRGEYF